MRGRLALLVVVVAWAAAGAHAQQGDGAAGAGGSPIIPASVRHNCAARCGIEFGQTLERYISESTTRRLMYLNLDAIYEVYTDGKKYKGFCKGFTQFKLCVEQCTPSFFKTIAKAGAKVIDYSCIDRRDDILRYFPCSFGIGVSDRCTQACSRAQQDFSRTVDSFATLALTGDLEEVSRRVRSGCDYMRCVLDCDLPQRIPPCGDEFKRLVDDLVSTMFQRLVKFMQQIGFIDEWPAQCVALQRYRTPDAPVLPVSDAGGQTGSGRAAASGRATTTARAAATTTTTSSTSAPPTTQSTADTESDGGRRVPTGTLLLAALLCAVAAVTYLQL